MTKISSYIYITIGTFIAALGFYLFNDSINIVTGGAGGLGIVLGNLFSFPTSYMVYALNFCCLAIGFIVFGKNFIIKTIYSSLLYPTFILLFEQVDKLYGLELNIDNTLVMVIMGSICVASGIGLTLIKGGSTGGFDILMKILNEKFKIPYSVTIYLVDGLVVLLAFFAFGVEIGIYSLIGMLLNGVVIDKITLSNPVKVVEIITNKPDEISKNIFEKLDRGLTNVPCLGGYSKDGRNLLICVARNNEYTKIVNIVQSIDSEAFIYVFNASDVSGRGFGKEKRFIDNRGVNL